MHGRPRPPRASNAGDDTDSGGPDDLITVEGLVQRIRFRNDENFWTVASLKVPGNPAPQTIVGTMPGLAEGMRVEAVGRYVENAKFGRQLQVVRVIERVPATVKGLQGYLASGFIPGIGPKMAERIVAHFGTAAVEIIKANPARLAEVQGIGKKRADTLAAVFRERHAAQEAFVFLFGLGVPKGMAARIIKRYGDDTVMAVRKNPYSLAEEVHGIGFLKADQVALGLNIDPASIGRLRAGVYHCLRVARGHGHCFVSRERLVADAAELLGQPVDVVLPALMKLVGDGKAVLQPDDDRPNDDRVYLAPLFEAEVQTAGLLADLLGAAVGEADGDRRILGDRVDAAAGLLDIALAPGQRNAVIVALDKGVVIVTGGPGTGKTTIIRTLLEATRVEEHRVVLTAPTGRAAKRMSEATGRAALTIHRLLEFSPADGQFQRDALNPLDVAMVVVDEASMVDLPLFYALVRAIPAGARLVLVGDADQLPPVGPGSPLADLIRGGSIPLARLTRIYRQGQGSAIVQVAHDVNTGTPPKPTPSGTPLQDFYFVARQDPDDIRRTIEDLVTQRIPQRFGFDPVRDVQVLAPMRAGPVGVERLNRRLQQLLNPPPQSASSGPPADDDHDAPIRLRVGDKVMQLRNDYDRGVYNGDVGIVRRVDPKSGALNVIIDGRDVAYKREEQNDIVLAYAVTVHKSQGSEYPVVVMPVSTQHFKMLQRNLLYTGITRGKRLVILVGTPRAVRLAVDNYAVTQRNSALDSRLAALL